MKRNNKFKRKPLKPKTRNQTEYIRAMAESVVTLCFGPAGTGKTSVSVGLACEHLLAQKVKKIIITRPVVESGHGLGYLPGTFKDKIHPYLIPVLDEMKMYLTKTESAKFLTDDTIEIVPLEYMRGRNFHNSFIILDEAQNATFNQIKMFITRIGKNSKAVINGDLQQSDLSAHHGTGFYQVIEKLANTRDVSTIELTNEDIIRNPIIGAILNKLQ